MVSSNLCRENYIILLGGAKRPGLPVSMQTEEKDTTGIVVVSGKKLRKNSDRRRLWFIESTSGNVIDSTLVFNSPWPNQIGTS